MSLFTLLDAVSMAATIESQSVDLFEADAAFQFSAPSATHVGVVKVQVSNDETNWDDYTDITGSDYQVASGSAYGHTEDVTTASRWARAVYTFTSGVGALTCKVNLKPRS